MCGLGFMHVGRARTGGPSPPSGARVARYLPLRPGGPARAGGGGGRRHRHGHRRQVGRRRVGRRPARRSRGRRPAGARGVAGIRRCRVSPRRSGSTSIPHPCCCTRPPSWPERGRWAGCFGRLRELPWDPFRPRPAWAGSRPRSCSGLMNVLFLGFAVAQLVALSEGGRRVIQTAGLTYAEYARTGLFQLLAVAAITLAIVLSLRAALDQTDPRIRRRFAVLAEVTVVLTLVVVFVAVRRLGLYTDAFGLTMLRLCLRPDRFRLRSGGGDLPRHHLGRSSPGRPANDHADSQHGHQPAGDGQRRQGLTQKDQRGNRRDDRLRQDEQRRDRDVDLDVRPGKKRVASLGHYHEQDQPQKVLPPGGQTLARQKRHRSDHDRRSHGHRRHVFEGPDLLPHMLRQNPVGGPRKEGSDGPNIARRLQTGVPLDPRTTSTTPPRDTTVHATSWPVTRSPNRGPATIKVRAG